MAGRMRQHEWRSLTYFYDNLGNTDNVAKFIKKHAKGQHGSFLLRPSSRNPDLLTASILVPDGSVRHTHIMIENDARRGLQYYLVPEKKFATLLELLSYYKINPVRNLENVNNVYLLHPISKRPNLHDNSSFDLHASGNSFKSISSLDSLKSAASAITSDGPPPLPVRPKTRSESMSSLGSQGSSVNTSAPKFSLSLDRPPCPLPDDASAVYDKSKYSTPRDTARDISQQLKDALKSSERCECGIPRHLAELPLGWTVHMCKEPPAQGKLFYQSPEEKTYWALPDHVEMQLTRKHKENLKEIDKNWNAKRVSAPSSNGIDKK